MVVRWVADSADWWVACLVAAKADKMAVLWVAHSADRMAD